MSKVWRWLNKRASRLNSPLRQNKKARRENQGGLFVGQNDGKNYEA
jgi:hypothetical protein